MADYDSFSMSNENGFTFTKKIEENNTKEY